MCSMSETKHAALFPQNLEGQRLLSPARPARLEMCIVLRCGAPQLSTRRTYAASISTSTRALCTCSSQRPSAPACHLLEQHPWQGFAAAKGQLVLAGHASCSSVASTGVQQHHAVTPG